MGYTYSINTIIRTEKPNKSGLCPLYLRYTYKRKWKYIPLNKTLEPKYWNKEENEPRKKCPNRKEILDLIRRKKTDIETIILNHSRENGEYPSPEELIEIIYKGKKDKSWDYYFDLFVESQTKEKYVEKSTLEVYRQLKIKLSNFLFDKEIKWSWKSINTNFYNQFVSYLKENKLKISTIGKHVKTLKSFLNFVSIKYDLINPNQYRNFITLREETDFTILTYNDIEIMKSSINTSSIKTREEYRLTERENILIRKMILLCKTGMNYCDLEELKVEDIYNDKDLFIEDDENKEISSNLYIKKIRKKLKKVDKKLIPIIPITHEISDLLRLSFKGYDRIFHSVKMIMNVQPFYQNETYSLTSLWKMLKLLDTMSLEEKKDFLPTYPYLLPKIDNVLFNREIKILLDKIGINYNVKIVEVTGQNKVVENVVPKNKIVSSRTGRRTYITNSISMGVSSSIVMRTTGIKKNETLRRYENISEKDIVDQVKDKNPKPQKFNIKKDKKTH